MNLKLFLEAIVYIPYSIFHLKKLKDKSDIESYADGEKRIKTIILPVFYILLIATILSYVILKESLFSFISAVLVLITIFFGIIAFKCIGILRQIKIRTCRCGRLLTRDDDFEYEVIEEKDDCAVVAMKFVCKECKQQKSVKCKFPLETRRSVIGYKDETVYKAKATKNPGEYEIRTETKRVPSKYHEDKDTISRVIGGLFSNSEHNIKEIK